jgi:hypothetical protein
MGTAVEHSCPLSAPFPGNTDHGVLKFSFYSTSYQFHFIPKAGKTFKNSGRSNRH